MLNLSDRWLGWRVWKADGNSGWQLVSINNLRKLMRNQKTLAILRHRQGLVRTTSTVAVTSISELARSSG